MKKVIIAALKAIIRGLFWISGQFRKKGDNNRTIYRPGDEIKKVPHARWSKEKGVRLEYLPEEIHFVFDWRFFLSVAIVIFAFAILFGGLDIY